MELYIGNYWYLLLLLLLPALWLILKNYHNWRRSRQERFARAPFTALIFPESGGFSRRVTLLYLLGFTFLILALIDVLGGREEIKTQQKMNNVIFLLDISNSMNAEDIQPNRLTAAKNFIVNTIKELNNDRVGVVVFAGEAASVMPLTTDFTAAETYIDGIETSVVKIQGTDFLKAVQESVKKFKNVPKGARQIVLVSDGEDNEGHEREAARLAASEGITICSVGIGTAEGAPVPEYLYGQLMGYKTDLNGETVISKRQTGALDKLASDTGGIYLDGNNMENAVKQAASALQRRAAGSSMMVTSQNATHYYQYFLAVSMLFFIIIYLFNPKRDLNH